MAKTTFISWNVNGIRAVEKKEALKWIDDEKIDFLGLQEIKAEADQIPDSIFEKNYKFQSINSSSNKVDYFFVSKDLKEKIVDTDILDLAKYKFFHLVNHFIQCPLTIDDSKKLFICIESLDCSKRISVNFHSVIENLFRII